MRITQWVLAAALIVSLTAAVLAQPATNQQAQSGADSPKAAAEAFLAGAKAKDVKKVLAVIPPSDAKRAETEEQVKAFLDCMEIKEYKVGNTTGGEGDSDEATVAYTWKMTFDTDKLIEVALKQQAKQMAEMGHEMTDEQIQQMKQMMAMAFAQMKTQFEQSEQEMAMKKVDGKWYVSAPVKRDH